MDLFIVESQDYLHEKQVMITLRLELHQNSVVTIFSSQSSASAYLSEFVSKIASTILSRIYLISRCIDCHRVFFGDLLGLFFLFLVALFVKSASLLHL